MPRSREEQVELGLFQWQKESLCGRSRVKGWGRRVGMRVERPWEAGAAGAGPPSQGDREPLEA